jgi:hypothetical protein
MNTEELNRLLEKYYSGTSTKDEEEILRTFFSQDNIPDSYEAEKAMFGYFTEKAGFIEASANLEERIIEKIDREEKQSKRTFLTPSAISYMSIAAGILILIGLWFFSENRKYSDDTFKDPRIAYAETIKILEGISTRMSGTEEALAPVGKMNEATSRGLRHIVDATSKVENNLKSLGYMQKALDITKIADENK